MIAFSSALARLYLLHVAEKKIFANSLVYSRTFLTQVSLLIHLNVPFLSTNFTLMETATTKKDKTMKLCCSAILGRRIDSLPAQ